MFILPFGSDEPGIAPTIIVHLVLQRSCLGKLRTEITIAETLYSERLKGLNQSMFRSRPMIFDVKKNGSDVI